MAVTLTVAMLMQPTGELSEHYFPQGDAGTQVLGWMQAAKSLVEADGYIGSAAHDRAAAAWVYYRAYDYIANQLAALPSSAREGQGAIEVSWSASQIVHYRNLARQKLAEFESVRQSAGVSFGWHFGVASGRRGQ